MSSRALRKAQREREEQEQSRRLDADGREESEDDATPKPVSKKSAFAMLAEEEEEGDDDTGVDEPANSEREHIEGATEASIPKMSSSKKKKKKKKGKSGGGTPAAEAGTQDQQLDDIDKALEQLSTNGKASSAGTTTSGINAETDELCRLLAIDTSHLHAQSEMRRLFGCAALEQQDGENQHAQNANVGGNRRQQRRVQQVGLAQALRGQHGQAGRSSGLAAIALKKNIFIHGKEEWPAGTGGGLAMIPGEKRADGTILYKFTHNSAYKETQHQFAIAQESMDPNRLIVLLQQNPYHISTLLQVSEIAKHDRDHADAGDLLERALFSFGRAVHSSFAKTLADGKARLDFNQPENREFWLASWRYMQNLSMRGTWRTVYEWGRLLLSLSPEEDPYALWLILDQYALRARQDLDFLNLSRSPVFREKLKDMPNIQLSAGLAEFRAGNKSKGRQALFTAIGHYPWVIFRLMRELNLDPAPAIWGQEPRSDKEKLESELYATRAKDLWNTPEASNLLVEVASAVQPDTPPAEPHTTEIERNEARHVLLADIPPLIALLPRHFTADTGLSSDPLPPHDPNAPPRVQYSSGQDRHGELHMTEVAIQSIEALFRHLFPQRLNGEEQEAGYLGPEELERATREHGLPEGYLAEELMSLRQLELNQRTLAGERDDDAEAESDLGEDDGDDSGGRGLRARVSDGDDSGG